MLIELINSGGLYSTNSLNLKTSSQFDFADLRQVFLCFKVMTVDIPIVKCSVLLFKLDLLHICNVY